MNFAGVLTLIFVVLKLIGVITWSWWFVFAPTLVAIGLTFVVLAVLGVIAGSK